MENKNEMISTQKALDLILYNTNVLFSENINLKNAINKILSKDICAPISIPFFNQSAMDGYAFCFDKINLNAEIKIDKTIPAGYTKKIILKENTLIRIFTGAPLPEGADTVVMQEWIEVNNGYAIFKNKEIKKGANVRLIGSQIIKNKIVAQKGSKLTPGLIGLLSSLGILEIEVFCNPKIAIITTGDEIIKTGKILKYGQVYEGNSITLISALAEKNIKSTFIKHSKDNEKTLSKDINNALSKCDLILITGGISVGDYDFTKQALFNNGVTQIFYKIKQKPGKPLFFGKKENKLIFALPGNPASVLTCFYLYVIPCIKKILGFENNSKAILYLKLENEFTKKQGLTNFLKGKINSQYVTILNGQESFRLDSYNTSDCIIELEENKIEFKKEDIVKVYDLTNIWN